MANINVVDGYVLAPGCCYLCRSDRRGDEAIFDTGIDIDWEGRLYICETCAQDMAGHGNIAKGRAEAQKAKVEGLEAENSDLKRQVRALTLSIDGLKAGGYRTAPQKDLVYDAETGKTFESARQLENYKEREALVADNKEPEVVNEGKPAGGLSPGEPAQVKRPEDAKRESESEGKPAEPGKPGEPAFRPEDAPVEEGDNTFEPASDKERKATEKALEEQREERKNNPLAYESPIAVEQTQHPNLGRERDPGAGETQAARQTGTGKTTPQAAKVAAENPNLTGEDKTKAAKAAKATKKAAPKS